MSKGRNFKLLNLNSNLLKYLSSFLDFNTNVSLLCTNKNVSRKLFSPSDFVSPSCLIYLSSFFNVDDPSKVLCKFDGYIEQVSRKGKLNYEAIACLIHLLFNKENCRRVLIVPDFGKNGQIYRRILPLISNSGVTLAFTNFLNIAELDTILNSHIEAKVTQPCLQKQQQIFQQRIETISLYVYNEKHYNDLVLFYSQNNRDTIKSFNIILNMTNFVDNEDITHSLIWLHKNSLEKIRIEIHNGDKNFYSPLKFCPNLTELIIHETMNFQEKNNDIFHIATIVNSLHSLKVLHFESSNPERSEEFCSAITHYDLREIKIKHSQKFAGKFKNLLYKNKIYVDTVHLELNGNDDSSFLCEDFNKLNRVFIIDNLRSDLEFSIRTMEGSLIQALDITYKDEDLIKYLNDTIQSMPNLSELNLHLQGKKVAYNTLTVNGRRVLHLPMHPDVDMLIDGVFSNMRLPKEISNLDLDIEGNLFKVILKNSNFTKNILPFMTSLSIRNYEDNTKVHCDSLPQLRFLKLSLIETSQSKAFLTLINKCETLSTLDIDLAKQHSLAFLDDVTVTTIETLSLNSYTDEEGSVYDVLIRNKSAFRRIINLKVSYLLDTSMEKFKEFALNFERLLNLIIGDIACKCNLCCKKAMLKWNKCIKENSLTLKAIIV